MQEAPSYTRPTPTTYLPTQATPSDWEEAVSNRVFSALTSGMTRPVVQHCHIENHVLRLYGRRPGDGYQLHSDTPHCGVLWARHWAGPGEGAHHKALHRGASATSRTPCTSPLRLSHHRGGGRPVNRHEPRGDHMQSGAPCHPLPPGHIFPSDGTLWPGAWKSIPKQGAYASHGHSIAAKATSGFAQLYKCKAYKFGRLYGLPIPGGGAMRPTACPGHFCHGEPY